MEGNKAGEWVRSNLSCYTVSCKGLSTDLTCSKAILLFFFSLSFFFSSKKTHFLGMLKRNCHLLRVPSVTEGISA